MQSQDDLLNSVDLMVDRMVLKQYRELAAEIIERIETLEAKYPPGTFNGAAPVEVVEALDEPSDIVVRAVKPRGKPPKKRSQQQTGVGVSDAVRAYIAKTGRIKLSEYTSLNPQFKRSSVSALVYAMARKGELKLLGSGEFTPA